MWRAKNLMQDLAGKAIAEWVINSEDMRFSDGQTKYRSYIAESNNFIFKQSLNVEALLSSFILVEPLLF